MKHLEQAEKNNKANKLYAIEIKECPDVIVQGTQYTQIYISSNNKTNTKSNLLLRRGICWHACLWRVQIRDQFYWR